MAKICLFCGQEIIQGFSSCAHNWAWREIDDDKFDDISNALTKRTKGALKKGEVIIYKDKELNFENAQKEVINGITVYDFEENGITVYENEKKNKIIVFCNDNAFLVDNCQTNVIDILYETDEDGNIKIEKKEAPAVKKTTRVNKVETPANSVETNNNVESAPTPAPAPTPYRPRRVYVEEEPTTFKYGDIEVGKENLVSVVNMNIGKIFASLQSANEFLSLLRKNEKLFLPTTDARYMAKFHTIERELFACPSLGIFLFCLHSDEAIRKGERYTLYPIYDEYYGKMTLREKSLREIRDAYKFRKYWSTESEKACYELISYPAVQTLFTDFYLPKVLVYTAISGEDRRILNNVSNGKSQKENFVQYMGF